MRASSTDSVGVLVWGLRRYWLLLVACVLVGAVVAPWVDRQTSSTVEAEALVIAQRLDMDLEALPRYGEAVFGNGEVALAVATNVGGVGDDVIPDRVELVTEQDSLVMRVIGRDEDPATAAQLANVASEAFVQALNSTGAGIGLFGVQSPAEPPSGDQAGGLGTLLSLALGIAAGLVLALAVISLLLVLRRPVIEAADAEETTGVPALGTVTVPRARRGLFASPEDFSGLVPVCRRLLALPTPTVLLVGDARDGALREQLSVAMAGVLMRVRPVSYVGSAEATAVLARRTPAVETPEDPATGGTGAPAVTLVDSREPLDLVQSPHLAATVLVAPVGIRSARLREAVVEHLGGSAESRILLVRRGPRVRNGDTVAQTTEGRPVQPADQPDLPEHVEPVEQR